MAPRSLVAGLRIALLCGIAGLVSGCMSFRSVGVAATMGQLVGARAGAAGYLTTFCEAENILAGAQPTCPMDKVKLYTQEITLYSHTMARYATMVKDLADFNDPRSSDELTQLMLGLSRAGQLGITPTDRSGQQIAAAAAALTAAFSQTWRRNKLETLIESSHSHVIAIIDGLLGRIDLLSEPVRDLAEGGLERRRMMLSEVDRPSPGGKDAPDPVGRLERQASRVALLQFQLLAQKGLDALQEYQKSLLAWKRAHSILFEYVTRHSDGIASDKEMYNLLTQDLPKILR
jgi:hypothetical protein